MQVAHHNDFITHAVIGGGETIDFGISNSAEFFNILSSTLYKDQILAVVRETLCNEWDAHIEAGITHIPVEVTLDAEKFIIRDFGKGIHKDDMGLIYGTYGNSTKKNDGLQTGGFGLGCKSPFAYTDHFEVVSFHDGVKTIYNLSKSSAAAMGKPGIVPIASFPTTETGLQVTIRIKSATDFHRFRNLINRIASNGDMNVKVNGNLVTPLGFDISKSNYLISEKQILDTQTRIMIRYGNVVYPVDTAESISDNYKAVVAHLDKLKPNSYSRGSSPYHILFQAPPHSISVTPSRESLSMQEHTINTLNKLMEDFLVQVKADFDPACQQYAFQAIKEAVTQCNLSALLSRDKKLPQYKVELLPNMMSDVPSQAVRYMAHNYPSDTEFRKQDISYRLKSMSTAGLLDRGMVQTFLRDLEGKGAVVSPTWLQRRVISPLLVKMQAAGIDHARLSAYDSCDKNSPPSSYRDKSIPPLVPATQISPKSMPHMLPYLRNIVVIGCSRLNIWNRAQYHTVFKERGIYEGFLFYQASMKKDDKIKAIKFFTELGMEVVDLTQRQEWEPAPPRHVADRAPRKAAKTGVLCLSSLIDPLSKGLNTSRCKLDDIDRIDNPEFILLASIRKDEPTDKFSGWDEKSSRYLVELFGDKGAFAHNAALRDKWINKGAQLSEAYFQDKIIHEMLTNTRIHAHWSFEFKRALDEGKEDRRDYKKLVQLIYGNQVLRTEFGLVSTLNDRDKKFVYLWKGLLDKHENRYPYHIPDELKQVDTMLKKIPLDPANMILMKKIQASPLIKLFEMYQLESLFYYKDSKPQAIATAIKALITIINN